MMPKIRFLRQTVHPLTDREVSYPEVIEISKMELQSRDFRAMIFNDFNRGLSYQESYKNLCEAFGSCAPGKSTVSKWFREFEFGRETLKTAMIPGRPLSAATAENADRVRELIEEDPRITVRDIRDILRIGMTAIDVILHQHLGVRKRCAKWVPHCLTEEQKGVRVEWCQTMLEHYNSGRSKATYNIISGDETWVYQFEPETKALSAVWIFPGDSPPEKFRRSRSTGKQMVASFVSQTGHIATIPLVERRTVTADWYTQQCLPKVLQAARARRPNSPITLHHDNAPDHTASTTRDFLAGEGVQLISHPPYSPDLAPCDFAVFPKVKNQLRGTRFDTPQDAVRAFTRAIEGNDEVTWSEVWRNWFERMQRCIAASGGYFEKLS